LGRVIFTVTNSTMRRFPAATVAELFVHTFSPEWFGVRLGVQSAAEMYRQNF
jgi:hypothetical protein